MKSDSRTQPTRRLTKMVDFLLEQEKEFYRLNLFIENNKHALSFVLTKNEFQDLKNEINRFSEIRRPSDELY